MPMFDIRVTWLICVTWLILGALVLRDMTYMTYTYAWHACDMTHIYAWHTQDICVSHVTYMWHHSPGGTRQSQGLHVCGPRRGGYGMLITIHQEIYICNITHSTYFIAYMWYDLWTCYLLWDKTFKYSRHDSVEVARQSRDLHFSCQRYSPPSHCNILRHAATHCNTLQHTTGGARGSLGVRRWNVVF